MPRFKHFRVVFLGVVVALIVGLGIAVFFYRSQPRYVATSPDGRIHFIAVKYDRGTLIKGRTSFFVSLGTGMEKVYDFLWKLGIHIFRTGTVLNMDCPPDCHLFVVEYAGDKYPSNGIKADLIQADGRTFRLLPCGGGTFGTQKRQFAYWTLISVPELDWRRCQIKVYFPDGHPTFLSFAPK